MSTQTRCTCSRCTTRGLMGPAVITTLGILFLLSELQHGGMFSFGHTFPIILIVIGAINLAAAVAPMDGHIGTPVAPVPYVPPAPPPAATPPSSTYNPPYSGQGQ